MYSQRHLVASNLLLNNTSLSNIRLDRNSLKEQQIGVPDEDSIRELVQAGGIEAPKGPAGSMLLFECNVLHGSNANMSPYPRSNVFFVFNSVENRLQQPFAARKPRPWFLAAR